MEKANIPIGRGSLNPLDLPADHHTSMNFLLAKPVYYRHAIKGEHIIAPLVGTVYAQSLYRPTFGRAKNNLRAFFCPYRLVMPNYDHMRANTIASNASSNAIVTNAPNVDMKTITDYFLNTVIVNVGPLVELLTSYDPTDPNETRRHDFQIYDSSTPPNKIYYRYTPAGRRRVSLLRCLGYEVIWDPSQSTFKYDVLALLCYARVYLDWYSNSQYLDSATVLRLERLFAYNDPSSALALDQTDFATLLRLVFAVTYDNDAYFNKAWDVPAGPTANQFSVPTVNDISGFNVQVASDSIGTMYMKQGNNTTTSIGTQYLHDMLQALSNYQRRHALSGARVIDRYLVDAGFVPDVVRQMHRSTYIGNNSMDIQMASVMAHADTNPNGVSNLGERAGSGFGQAKGMVEYTVDEDGMFVIISSIIPSGGFVQGYDRNNRHLTNFDFADPQLQVGVQVIERGEVYVSGNSDFSDQSQAYDTKFAFTGRFGEYLRPKSWDSSENAFDSVNFGVDAWTLFRKFNDDSFGNSAGIIHNLDFTIGNDWETYNRIFNYIGSDRDKFECFYHFDVKVQTPLKSLFDTYDFRENHKRIKMDINGSTLN